MAFPTGTSYGLAVDPRQGFALERLRLLKNRPEEKTFTLFMPATLWNQYLNLTSPERDLLARTENQPLTLLVRPQDSLTHLAKDGRVGLRVIDHPMMYELAQAFNGPLTATSANKSGEAPCYSSESIIKLFSGMLDETTYDLSLGYILDGGNLPPRSPSTIAKIVDDKVEIIRKGGLLNLPVFI